MTCLDRIIYSSSPLSTSPTKAVRGIASGEGRKGQNKRLKIIPQVPSQRRLASQAPPAPGSQCSKPVQGQVLEIT